MTTQTGPRRRDAAGTRRLLLEAARRRFAADGYAAATVRDIATDAGVNVALINRYFTSKEGLFEACLSRAVTEIRRDTDDMSQQDVAAAIAHRIAGSATPLVQEALLLLLRSSGDERIDEIRRTVVRTMSERLAATGRPGPPDEQRVLRAQMVIATSLGMTVLRSSLAVAPLTAATEQDLQAPLTDLMNALLPRAQDRPGDGQQPLRKPPEASQHDRRD
jgi:AcrR family transcriptional regulator